MPKPDSATERQARRRPYRVNVRFSLEEYSRLQEQARITCTRPATLLRLLALNLHLKPVQRFPDDVHRAIKSLSGNLNQLAHRANMGFIDSAQVEGLRRDVARFMERLLA